MTEATPDFDLTATGDGRYRLAGELSFATAEQAYRQGQALSSGFEVVVLDLSALSRIDSAGLAVLVEWWRQGQAGGQTMKLEGIPDQLHKLIAISGLEFILLSE